MNEPQDEPQYDLRLIHSTVPRLIPSMISRMIPGKYPGLIPIFSPQRSLIVPQIDPRIESQMVVHQGDARRGRGHPGDISTSRGLCDDIAPRPDPDIWEGNPFVP